MGRVHIQMGIFFFGDSGSPIIIPNLELGPLPASRGWRNGNPEPRVGTAGG
jgi:hypothetical protein